MYQIKSESDKKNTLKWLANFKTELEAIMKADLPEEVREAQANSIKSLIIQLEKQLEEYEDLKKGNYSLPDEVAFSDLLGYLVKIRISKGISQSELARKLGISKQQISRYEEHDYQGASIARINKILEVLGVKISIKLQVAA
ncbi:MAG TPA: helix-turn-helix transcriptional regulator [Candidatus Gastranaerophilales bacterium]|nr:helix-turn-helix transcriptional regulator [Candidatus Gastranaerophilales bacterium]